MLCHFVNEDGKLVKNLANDRVMAVNPIDLRASRDLIRVSGGWHKLKILTASLRLLKPSVLIANERVAERLAATAACPAAALDRRNTQVSSSG